MKLFLKRVLSYIPTKIPVGVTAHNEWAADIVELSGLPDNDSMRFTLASMVPHAPAHLGYVSKHFFVVRLLKAAANQVAGGVMMDLKEKQAAAVKAEQEAQAAALAATTPTETTPVADTTPTQGAATDVKTV